MASDYSNLNFADQYDVANWKAKCEEQRRIAQRWPAYDPRMSTVEDYGWKLGPWSLRLVLEVWKSRRNELGNYVWHGSVACIDQIGYETVTINEGMHKGTKFEIPQDALLAVKSWEPEHFQQARYILAEMFGPILRPGDDHQQAVETLGLFTMQWRVKYEGPETWKQQQH